MKTRKNKQKTLRNNILIQIVFFKKNNISLIYFVKFCNNTQKLKAHKY